MAGVVFPSIGNALLPLVQMDRQRDRDERDFAQRTQERADNLAFRKEESQYRRESLDEQRAMRLQSHIATLDEKTRAKVKDFSEFRARGGMAVLSAPPEQRPQAYAMYVQEAKARGYDMSLFPQQWDPSTERRLQFDVDQSKPFADFFNQPQAMPPAGGGAPASSAAPNRDQFIQSMMPHAMEVSRQTGIDPRLVVAQAALETGWGVKAPGNNYFGIKSHGQPGGQTLATNEAGPGGEMVPTQASFRTYASPGESAQDYGNFLKTNSRYAPVMAAQGLDAQIDAMGKSGYATDPQYGAKLRQIAQGIGGPQPAMGAPPASMVAQGAGAAPMPNVSPQQVGALPGNPAAMPGGFTPTNTPASAMPLPQMPPGVEQGGGEGPRRNDVMVPPGAAPPQGPQQEVFEVRRWLNTAIPGAVPFAVKGQPVYDAQKNLMVRMPDGSTGWVPLPKPKEPRQEGPKTLEERDRETLLRGDPNTPEYAAAYAQLGAERVIPDPNSPGGFHRIRPDLSWARKPTFAGANAPQPATPPLPGGKLVETDPGRGKPLDNSARDDLVKAARPVLEMTELLKSFDPDFGGYMSGAVGDAANFAKRNLPDVLGGADPKGQAQWWQRYNMFANLERNVLFGSALTPTEKAAFEAAMVNPGMKPDQIKANLSRQTEIANKALSRMTNSMVAGGTNKEAIEAITGTRMSDLPDPIGGVPQGPPPGGSADKAKQQFDIKKKYGLD